MSSSYDLLSIPPSPQLISIALRDMDPLLVVKRRAKDQLALYGKRPSAILQYEEHADILGPQITGQAASDSRILTSGILLPCGISNRFRFRNDDVVEVSVLDRLPPEILDIIFQHYLTSRKPRRKEALKLSTPTNPSLLPSPLLLCQVCRSWRDMIFRIPSLWAELHIDAVEPEHCLSGSTVQLKASMVHGTHASAVKSWIARVGTYPSSLSIHTYRRVRRPIRLQKPSNSSVDIPLVSLLPSTFVESVRYFDFRGDAWTTGLGTLTFPAAHSVVVRSEEFARWANRYRWPVVDFPCFPALRKATLMGLMHPFSGLHSSSRIPWNQLTHLYLGKQVPCAKVLMVLKKATALQQGCFDVKASPPASHTVAALRPESNDFLPNLKDLTFMRNSPFDASFLEHGGISWPNLVRLRLCTEDRITWSRAFLQLFRSLTSLSLMAPIPTEFRTSAAPILNACPLLTSLSLALQLNSYEPLFEFLAFNPTKPRLLHLTDLKILCGTKNSTVQDPASFPHTQMYEMIASRSHVGWNYQGYEYSPTATLVPPDGPRLKKLVLWLPAGPAADIVEDTIRRDLVDRELSSSGLNISVLRKRPRKAVWNEIALDHWDYGLGPMLDSEDNLM